MNQYTDASIRITDIETRARNFRYTCAVMISDRHILCPVLRLQRITSGFDSSIVTLLGIVPGAAGLRTHAGQTCEWSAIVKHLIPANGSPSAITVVLSKSSN